MLISLPFFLENIVIITKLPMSKKPENYNATYYKVY